MVQMYKGAILIIAAWLFGMHAAIAAAEETAVEAGDSSREVVVRETPGGVPFGTWGDLPERAAPTLFIFGSTIEATLGNAYYRQAGDMLGRQGYLCISLDLPCHGREHREDEPEGLAGWAHRAGEGEDFITPFAKKCSEVLDYLVEEGYTDPLKVAACGTSRGGFMALQLLAREPRIRCGAAFAPVTDLFQLREFDGVASPAFVETLCLERHAYRLAGRPAWIIMGDQDARVGTDAAISLARAVTQASVRMGVRSALELHLMPGPDGHTTPQGGAKMAASWIAKQLAGG